MAKLSSTIHEYGFPGDFDTIRFQEVAAPMTFRVACEDAAIDLLLSPDEKQCVVVEDFAPVLRDFTADGMPRVCTLTWDGGQQAFTVLPCRCDVDDPAADFCALHFLTPQGITKRTYRGALELLTLFSPDGEERPAFSVSLTWWNEENGSFLNTTMTEGEVGSASEVAQGLWQIDVSPQRFAIPKEGYTLHSYAVCAGRRELKYVLSPSMDAVPLTLVFKNAFGQFDTFHLFGNVQKEMKPTRSSATFSGKFRNYLVKAVPEFTAQTGILRQEDEALFADLCSATEVRLRSIDGPEVVIVDNDMKILNDAYEPQQGSISFRYAGRGAVLHRTAPFRTFDDTFDETYL